MKLQEAGSLQTAVGSIMDGLGREAAATAAKVGAAQMYRYADADSGQRITVEQAIDLDVAYAREHAGETPIFDHYQRTLDYQLEGVVKARKPLETLVMQLGCDVGQVNEAVLALQADGKAKATLSANDRAKLLGRVETLRADVDQMLENLRGLA